jgi:hypothetical protein
MNASLAQQQRALLEALWQPCHPDAMKIIADHALPIRAGGQNLGERGFKAYRSNAQELAQRALAAAYPVVAELIGADSFRVLAQHCWQRHPPRRGDLAQWGAALAGFVDSLPDLALGEPYLADVARIEWALHCAATAPDAQPDTASFAMLADHDAAQLTLVTGPGTVCVDSTYPVVSIIQAHLQGEPTLEEAGRRLRGQVRESALVWRQGFKPRLRQAQPGETSFISALRENRSLLDALDAAPGFDFAAWLPPAIQAGLLLGVRLLENP